MRKITCIICPRGCTLEIEEAQGNEGYIVTGQMCKRGREFAINELTNPTRTITTTVKTIYPEIPRLPVKTSGEVPLGKIFEVMKVIDKAVVTHMVKSGEVIVKNVLDLDVDIVAASDMYIMMGV